MIRRSNSIRSAFTLVELLVVIAIIALLAAISIAAVFAVQTAQKKSDTEATLNKVDTKLQAKLKLIQEQINEDWKNNRAEAPVFKNAGLSEEQAKALMMYARSRQQLPMTIKEGKTAITLFGYTYPSSPIFTTQTDPAQYTPEESAACLYLALAPLGLEGLEQQVGDSGIAGFKCFKDQYAQPIAFNRLMYDGNNGELNNPPYTRVVNSTIDPFDPAGKATAILTLAWGNTATTLLTTATPANGGPPVWAGVPGTYAGAGGAKRNHTATAISGGPNNDFDLPLGIANADNLLSFRLRREGTRGD